MPLPEVKVKDLHGEQEAAALHNDVVNDCCFKATKLKRQGGRRSSTALCQELGLDCAKNWASR